MRDSITMYRLLSRIVSPFNTSHHTLLDVFHHKCYDSVEETAKAKGD
jgi:hypothetical protein